MKATITITAGDVAENGPQMQKIGQEAKRGLSPEELKAAGMFFLNRGNHVEYIDLAERSGIQHPEVQNAAILIVRGGLASLLPDGSFIANLRDEFASLNWDTKANMRGKVKNKIARHNLCFSDFNQEPNYEEKKGRVYDLKTLPLLNQVNIKLHDLFRQTHPDLTLNMEGNLYYDPAKCGIGFHGDTERKIVIAFRMGATMPLHYQWFHDCGAVGNRIQLTLNDGDVYFMSEKAVGQDWRKRSKYTLRHAAGCEKYLLIKDKQDGKKEQEGKIGKLGSKKRKTAEPAPDLAPPFDLSQPRNPNYPNNPRNPYNPNKPDDTDGPWSDFAQPRNPYKPHKPHNPFAGVDFAQPHEPYNPHNPFAGVDFAQPHEPYNPVEFAQPHEPYNPVEFAQPREPYNPHNPFAGVDFAQPHEPYNPVEFAQPREPYNPNDISVRHQAPFLEYPTKPYPQRLYHIAVYLIRRVNGEPQVPEPQVPEPNIFSFYSNYDPLPVAPTLIYPLHGSAADIELYHMTSSLIDIINSYLY